MDELLAGTWNFRGELERWLCKIQIICLPHQSIFFLSLVSLQPPPPLPLFFYQKWPKICLTVPLALISVPPTRMFFFSSSALCQRLIFFFSHSCVGVWQNDRVEIIANDRMCNSSTHIWLLPIQFQRATAQHHPMSLSPMRSVSLVMLPKIRLR